jgi:hypothetical protein
MSHEGPGSRAAGTHVPAASGLLGLNLAVHLALLVVGLALAAVVTFIASFAICGISGCSGGGFGRATDPNATLMLLVCAGLVAAAPLAIYALWRRLLWTALFAAAVAIVVSIGSGLLVGADFRGCPRNVDTATCMDEAS